MDLLGGISTILSLVTFGIFVAGVMKVFQMTTLLSEIKDLLTTVKLNAPVGTPIGSPVRAPIGPPPGIPFTQSGEEMLRAALSLEPDHPENSASIELGNKN